MDFPPNNISLFGERATPIPFPTKSFSAVLTNSIAGLLRPSGPSKSSQRGIKLYALHGYLAVSPMCILHRFTLRLRDQSCSNVQCGQYMTAVRMGTCRSVQVDASAAAALGYVSSSSIITLIPLGMAHTLTCTTYLQCHLPCQPDVVGLPRNVTHGLPPIPLSLVAIP